MHVVSPHCESSCGLLRSHWQRTPYCTPPFHIYMACSLFDVFFHEHLACVLWEMSCRSLRTCTCGCLFCSGLWHGSSSCKWCETLAKSFMGALLNKKVHQSSNLQHFYILHIKSRLLKDNQLSWLPRLQEACSRLQDSNVRFCSGKNCIGVGEREGHCLLPQVVHVIFLLGLLYFCNIQTIWEPGTG